MLLFSEEIFNIICEHFHRCLFIICNTLLFENRLQVLPYIFSVREEDVLAHFCLQR